MFPALIFFLILDDLSLLIDPLHTRFRYSFQKSIIRWVIVFLCIILATPSCSYSTEWLFIFSQRAVLHEIKTYDTFDLSRFVSHFQISWDLKLDFFWSEYLSSWKTYVSEIWTNQWWILDECFYFNYKERENDKFVSISKSQRKSDGTQVYWNVLYLRKSWTQNDSESTLWWDPRTWSQMDIDK